MRFLPLLLLLLTVASLGAEIRGKVTNAVGGEPLGRVEVSVLGTKLSGVTSDAGNFSIANLASGNYTLRLNAVGFRLLTVRFTLAGASDVKAFDITMVPDNFHHAEKVEVHADLFQVSD